MRKTVVARKNCPYDPTLGGTFSRYEGHALIASGQQDPGIVHGCRIGVPEGFAGPILCSPSNRCRQTAELLSRRVETPGVIAVPELSEVRFDLRKLVGRHEYERDGSDLVRERFIAAFVQDRLDEPRGSIWMRLRLLLKKLSRGADEWYLLVSHSFILRILQAYLEEPDLFATPTLLRQHFDPGTKTFESGEGFEFLLPYPATAPSSS